MRMFQFNFEVFDNKFPNIMLNKVDIQGFAVQFHNLFIFACGFLVGVLGASLARKVYK